MKQLTLLLAAALAGVLLLAPGCGGDDKGGGGNGGLVIDVRNGTWEVVTVTSFSGADSTCMMPDETESETDTLCAQDVADFVNDEGLPFRINCEFEEGEGTFGFECSGTFTFGGCTITFQFSGSGQYTETSFTVTATSLVQVSGTGTACDDPGCLVTSVSTGTWMSSEGAETCEDGEEGALVSVPARSLVERTIARVFP